VETPQPPAGVHASDWERVLEARRAERLELNQLRCWGPVVQPDQAIIAVDDIEVRRPARRRFLALRFTTSRRLIPLWWQGEVAAALEVLEAYRGESRNTDKLDELLTYLTQRQPYLVNDKERRAQREYIGSGHAKKANDLIVARRQKHQGMHWSGWPGRPQNAGLESRLGTLLVGSSSLASRYRRLIP